MLFDELPSDKDLVRALLGELYDDLDGRLDRFRYLAGLDADFGGTEVTVLFGGSPTGFAYAEARSSYVHGNFMATIVICQPLLENLLAAYLHATGVNTDAKPRFDTTLRECRACGFLSEHEEQELVRLAKLRNPLTHFRHFDDGEHIDRRAIKSGIHPLGLIQEDARFAITLVTRIFGKAAFALGR